ncbi:PepSY domain-containing protein [Erythrobacteraceae bacterium CFH 75059]|uniref:PepSY domain-containing protein n=1 Tax=Qipengyuania thermophila TaxID=2509361 RepID=UPI00101EEDE8|nr:PepSY domain-containing protein [Qipengyuania thermophila]TCD04965.1 PepSY domain-containing protein [Erythrobacteraceae bacterium CFH 75059]
MTFNRVLCLAPLALVAAPAAAADRPPTPAERTQIERVLTEAGYVRWDGIELEQDDGRSYWEVDDARRADGSVWDLKLAPQTYAIIRTDRED